MKIEIVNLSKTYIKDGKEIKALDNITVTIPTNSFVTIVGPSGSGKTTFLLSLAGLTTPTSGDIVIDNETKIYSLNSTQRTLWRRKNVGIVFQDFNLLPYLTVIENVGITAFFDISKTKQQHDRAYKLVTQLGLEDRVKHYPSELSAGQQQRVALARGLLNKPQVVLADEPTANLDEENSKTILKLLIEFYKEGKTVIIVTQDKTITQVSNQTYIMENGNLQPVAI